MILIIFALNIFILDMFVYIAYNFQVRKLTSGTLGKAALLSVLGVSLVGVFEVGVEAVEPLVRAEAAEPCENGYDAVNRGDWVW